MTTPVADGLYRQDEGVVRLIAGRSRDDGSLIFPMTPDHDPVLLPPEGILWSWTVQRFRPKPPYDGDDAQDFRPYAVGYVQFGDLLIVQGRIVAADPAGLRIGQPMRTVVESYARDAQGDPIATYAFAPMAQDA